MFIVRTRKLSQYKSWTLATNANEKYQYDVIMSHGDVITRSTSSFCKGKQSNRSKTFFSWNKSLIYYVPTGQSKK